jgi:succinyl-CoA synthetase alpha subunit
MSILVNKETRIIVQGITGSAARRHTEQMLAYGTRVVAGVRPGAGGERVHGVPVYDQMKEAVDAGKGNASILFVPARAMGAAALEAMAAGIRLIVMVSEHVPLHDTLSIVHQARLSGATLIGPNTPGIIDPGLQCKIGFMPAQYYIPGPVGVASRSGTLTYEIVSRLTLAGIGQTTCLGIGGDPVIGTPFRDILRLFERDAATRAMLLIGEIGGSMEEDAAELKLKGEITKPVVAYIAGRTAPKGKKVGHAGAIVARGRGSIESKLEMFKAAGIPVAGLPGDVADLVKQALK